MEVIIVLRKTVPNKLAAENLVSAIKGKLADYPEVVMTAKTTETIDSE